MSALLRTLRTVPVMTNYEDPEWGTLRTHGYIDLETHVGRTQAALQQYVWDHLPRRVRDREERNRMASLMLHCWWRNRCRLPEEAREVFDALILDWSGNIYECFEAACTSVGQECPV